jgi:hypothetical protein
VLLTCGAFTPQGEFLELPELDLERLQTAWQEAVFALYLAEDRIEPEVVENMRTWPHSGFSMDQSVYLPAGDRAGIERLIGYMTRCPFSLSRLVQVTAIGASPVGSRTLTLTGPCALRSHPPVYFRSEGGRPVAPSI